jgi:[ribosomal protein S5]-alanine N-acetyltransferase
LIDFGFGVALGPISDTIAELLRLWRNDPKIYKWCRQVGPLEKFEHAAWLKSLEAGRPDVKMFSIIVENASVGACGLTSIDWINRRAEFSLYIAPEDQRKGYARAALKTLLKHGFESLNLHLIWGETFDGNPAAKMFEALGFRKEGTRREFYFKEGRYIDAHLYSVKREEVVWTG